MAKSFNKITSILYHPQRMILQGKYKDCRLDTILETDPDYCLWMHRNKYWSLSAESITVAKNWQRIYDDKTNEEDDKAYLEEQYGPFLEFEDVPF